MRIGRRACMRQPWIWLKSARKSVCLPETFPMLLETMRGTLLYLTTSYLSYTAGHAACSFLKREIGVHVCEV